MFKLFLSVADRIQQGREQRQENGPVRNFQILPFGLLNFLYISVKLRWLCWQNPATLIVKLQQSYTWRFPDFICFFSCVIHKVTSVITGGFIDQLSLHISICQGKGATLRLKDSIRAPKGKGRIDASLETPAALMYIQEYRKRVTNLLKICQVAFNHRAVGHSAKGPHRSKISSGAISLANLWSSALLEFNLLRHRVGIHTGGQMSSF